MPRVIQIDRSFTPKQRSAEAQSVKPPAPKDDLLKPRMFPGDAEGIAPTGPAAQASGSGQTAGKARQSRQAARKNGAPKQAVPPRVFVPKGNGRAAQQPAPTRPKPAANQKAMPLQKPRVFVPKVKSGNGPVVQQQPGTQSPSGKGRAKAKKKSVLLPITKKAFALMGQGVVATAKGIAKLPGKARQRRAAKQAKQQAAANAKVATNAKLNKPASGPPQIIIHRGTGPAPGATPVGQKPAAPPKQRVQQKQKPKPASQPRPAFQKTAYKPPPKPQAQKSRRRPAARSQPVAPPRTIVQNPVANPPPRPVKKQPAQPPARPRSAAPPPRPKVAAPPPVPSVLPVEPPPRPQRVPKPAPKDDQGQPGIEDLRHRRLVSLDAFRGFVVMLLAAAGFGVLEMAADPEQIGSFWYFAAPLFRPGDWMGVSAWDLIQPAFAFIVGVAVPFSYSHRWELGQSWNQMLAHAASRAGILVVMGVLLMSFAAGAATWEFTHVLSQIGLGYLVVFLLWKQKPILQLGYITAVLLGYAGMFFYYDWVESGMRAAELGLAKTDILPGVFAPFTKDVNFAAGFDRWFLNVFPRAEEFVRHAEGIHTLNFIPVLATMVLGLMTGEMLQGPEKSEQKFNKLLMGGVACLVLGVAAGITLIPIIARIWTPSWVLFSGAFVLWIFAAFYGIIEVLGKRRWALPLVIFGMNSIVAFLLIELATPGIIETVGMYGGSELFAGELGEIWQKCSVVAGIWVVCLYLYCRRIFFRV